MWNKVKTVEIDDAGWGDLVLGCLIGVLKTDTGELVVKEIGVEHFQPPKFQEKTYLEEAVKLVDEAFEELKITNEYTIKVCAGYVLSYIRSSLRRRGFKVVSSRITGKLQQILEQAFIGRLENVGFPSGTLTKESGVRRFFSLLKWVHEDLESREKLVKTGWASWQSKWRNWKAGQ